MTDRKHPVCTHCGSPDIVRDAWAEWDHERQCWELGEVFDHAHCAACDGETSTAWETGDPPDDGDS